MADKREDALSDLRLLIGSIDELVDALRRYHSECENTLRVLNDDDPVIEAFRHARTTNARSVTSDSLKTFERLRHRSRLSLIDLASEQGVTSRQFSTNLSVSRQLADRWMNQAKHR